MILRISALMVFGVKIYLTVSYYTQNFWFVNTFTKISISFYPIEYRLLLKSEKDIGLAYAFLYFCLLSML